LLGGFCQEAVDAASQKPLSPCGRGVGERGRQPSPRPTSPLSPSPSPARGRGAIQNPRPAGQCLAPRSAQTTARCPSAGSARRRQPQPSVRISSWALRAF
jgi:hypothetical protein